METVFIGFGSNVGDRVDFCDRAVTLLSLLPHSQLSGVSLLYETEPVRDGSNPGDGWFLNGVVQLETDLTPESLLSVLREIERSLGRDEQNRSGPRTIDLDILFFDSEVVSSKTLKIPHLRNLYQKVGMFGLPDTPFVFSGDNGHQGPQVHGFGYLHDGSVDTVFRFHRATLFSFSSDKHPIGALPARLRPYASLMRIDRPIGTTSSWPSHVQAVTSTDASVGPYRL